MKHSSVHGATAGWVKNTSLTPSSLKIKLVKSKLKILQPAFTSSRVRGEACSDYSAQHAVLCHCGAARDPGQGRVGAELLLSPRLHCIYPTAGREEQTLGTGALPPSPASPNNVCFFFCRPIQFRDNTLFHTRM